MFVTDIVDGWFQYRITFDGIQVFLSSTTCSSILTKSGDQHSQTKPMIITLNYYNYLDMFSYIVKLACNLPILVCCHLD